MYFIQVASINVLYLFKHTQNPVASVRRIIPSQRSHRLNSCAIIFILESHVFKLSQWHRLSVCV